MWRKLKIFLIKLEWVLFGGKPVKRVNDQIDSIKGVESIKPKWKIKVSNGNYASTKRTKSK